MLIRRAEERDIPRIHELLAQVAQVHHTGRPDLFRAGGRKYTDTQLSQKINDENTPIFVAVDDRERVLGYVFCQFEQYVNHNILTDVKTLYIDDLCVDEALRGQHIGGALYAYAAEFARKSGSSTGLSIFLPNMYTCMFSLRILSMYCSPVMSAIILPP